MLKDKRNFVLCATSFLALLTLLLGSAVSVSAQKKKKPVATKRTKPVGGKTVLPKEPIYTLPVGYRFRVRMDDTITSKTAKVGDTFTTTTVSPIYAGGGNEVIPAGSKVTGKITSVQAAQKGNKPGTLDVAFTGVALPSGKQYAINGSLTDLDANNTESDNEGTATGDKIDKRTIIFIGGGAAGGAILGSIIGGGKATAIGAIAGAGAGALADRFIKGPEAEVKPNTEFNIILNQAVSMPAYKK